MRNIFPLAILLIIAFSGSKLQAQNYLLRLEPKSVSETSDPLTGGTIEIHMADNQSFFVRSSLGDDAQFAARGALRKSSDGKLELTIYCRVSKLGPDPGPGLIWKEKTNLSLSQQVSLTSRQSNTDVADDSVELVVTILPLSPAYGAREATSGWVVRLVDESGNPVAGARGGLYRSYSEGPVDDDPEREPLVVGTSNAEGIIRFSEGREDLPWQTFYAEQKERKLYASSNLDADRIRDKDFQHYTVKMTKSDE
ncbi:MAG: hypothetical protein WD045_11120 [Pirellulaceae bacterium]